VALLTRIDAAIAEATGSPSTTPQPIVIKIRGGVVVEVTGMPPSLRYEVKDWDDEPR
jgi:hypothetical protein